MKILVTGGTGFIGGHLVDSLVNRGHDVRCLVRKTSNTLQLRQLGVELAYGDIRDAECVDEAVKAVDVIYHLAGVLGRWGLPDETYRDVHANGTNIILNSSLRQPMKRFIYCSTASVLGPVAHTPANETWPCSPTTPYGKAKAASEQLVMDMHSRFDLPVTIVRPEFVYGPRDQHLLPMFRAIKQGWFVIAGNGEAFLHPTFVSDLISGLLLVLERPKESLGGIYFIVGDRYVTVNQFVDLIRGALGKQGTSLHVPYSLASLAASLCESSCRLLPFSPPLTNTRLRLFNDDKAFSWQKATIELGYQPTVTLEEGISRTVKWYQENGMI